MRKERKCQLVCKCCAKEVSQDYLMTVVAEVDLGKQWPNEGNARMARSIDLGVEAEAKANSGSKQSRRLELGACRAGEMGVLTRRHSH
jgi:hypothetical protein